MLTELRIQDLGVIAELSLVLGPGMTALTGETGAGKTMLVEALDLLVGGRSDATLVRPGAAEAVVEGRFVHDGEELVLARVVPADGRSGPTSTAAWPRRRPWPRRAPGWSTCTVSTPTRACWRRPRSGRRSTTSPPSTSPRSPAPAAGWPSSRPRWPHSAATPGRRAREIDLLRFQVDEIAKAQLDGPDEDAELEKEALVLSDASAHREAAARAVGGPDRRRRRARRRPQRAGRGAGARGLRRGRRPVARARRGARRRGRRAAGAGRGHRGRPGAAGMDRRPSGPAPRAAPQVRRLAGRGAGLPRRGRGAPRRAGGLRGAGRGPRGGAGRGRGRGGRRGRAGRRGPPGRGAEAGPRRRRPPAPAGHAPGPARRRRRRWPARRRGDVPARRQPRRADAAAGQGGVGR